MSNHKLLLPLLFLAFVISGQRPGWIDNLSFDQLEYRSFKSKNKSFLLFSLVLDPDIYRSTTYGNPPQLAIWLSDSAGYKIQTVYVTQKSAKGKWDGKTSCPTCLPHYFQMSTKDPNINKGPSVTDPLPDAVTAATPADTLVWQIDLLGKDLSHFYIEINVSGDYNDRFKKPLPSSDRDDGGNGQPSLVYRGHIPTAKDPLTNQLEFIGQTDQFGATDSLINSCEGITLAHHLIKEMVVTYFSEP